MPTISDCQCLLQAVVQHAHWLWTQYLHQCHHLRISTNPSLTLGIDSDDSSNSSTSSSSTSTTSSYSSSSATGVSTVSSSAELKCALCALHKSYFQSIIHVEYFLSTLLSICVLFPHEVSKCSQLGLVITCYKEDDAPCFCQNLHVSPHTFNVLVSLIQDSPRFQNDSQNEQMPVPSQLAIALFHFGHFGSDASVDAVAQWAGCSAGAVINSTCCIIKAFLLLHDQAIRWPNADEKQEASDWVESMSCHAWRPSFCMVDGTLIPLASKPGHFGEQFFDRKSNYSLSLMVCAHFHAWITRTNTPPAHSPTKSLHYQLCPWPSW